MAKRCQCQNVFPASRARLDLRLCSSLSGPYSPLPAWHCRTVGDDGAGNHTSASQLRTARFPFLQRLLLTSILTILVSSKPLHHDNNPSTPLCHHLSLPYPFPPSASSTPPSFLLLTAKFRPFHRRSADESCAAHIHGQGKRGCFTMVDLSPMALSTQPGPEHPKRLAVRIRNRQTWTECVRVSSRKFSKFRESQPFTAPPQERIRFPPREGSSYVFEAIKEWWTARTADTRNQARAQGTLSKGIIDARHIDGDSDQHPATLKQLSKATQ